jgi:hypothetical protein
LWKPADPSSSAKLRRERRLAAKFNVPTHSQCVRVENADAFGIVSVSFESLFQSP